ncbi:hypothetical protein PAXINDRAFT_171146, partial [Paxillus involutus ATCC 200175]
TRRSSGYHSLGGNDPPGPQHARTSFTGIVRRIYHSSAFVAVGQLLISSAAWAFFGALAYHGQIPLPDSTVDL